MIESMTWNQFVSRTIELLKLEKGYSPYVYISDGEKVVNPCRCAIGVHIHRDMQLPPELNSQPLAVLLHKLDIFRGRDDWNLINLMKLFPEIPPGVFLEYPRRLTMMQKAYDTAGSLENAIAKIERMYE